MREAPGTRTILASGDAGRDTAEADLMRAVAVAEDGESLLADPAASQQERVAVQPLATAPFDAGLAAAAGAQEEEEQQQKQLAADMNAGGGDSGSGLHFLLWGLTLRLVGRILSRMGHPEMNDLVSS